MNYAHRYEGKKWIGEDGQPEWRDVQDEDGWIDRYAVEARCFSIGSEHRPEMVVYSRYCGGYLAKVCMDGRSMHYVELPGFPDMMDFIVAHAPFFLAAGRGETR